MTPVAVALLVLGRLPSGLASPAKPPRPAEVRVVFLGDTNFGENYQQLLGRRNVLTAKGYDYPLRNFAPLLKRVVSGSDDVGRYVEMRLP